MLDHLSHSCTHLIVYGCALVAVQKWIVYYFVPGAPITRPCDTCRYTGAFTIVGLLKKQTPMHCMAPVVSLLWRFSYRITWYTHNALCTSTTCIYTHTQDKLHDLWITCYMCVPVDQMLRVCTCGSDVTCVYLWIRCYMCVLVDHMIHVCTCGSYVTCVCTHTVPVDHMLRVCTYMCMYRYMYATCAHAVHMYLCKLSW